MQPPWRPSHTGSRAGPGFNKPKKGGGCLIAAIATFALVCVAGGGIGLVFFLKGRKAPAEDQTDVPAASAEVVTPPPAAPEPSAAPKPLVVARPNVKKDAGSDAAKAAGIDASTSAVTTATATATANPTATATATANPTATATPTATTTTTTTPTSTSTGLRLKVPVKKSN